MELIKGDLRIAPRTNISSTEIREKAKKGDPFLLTDTTKSVATYISDNDLYRENL